MEVLPQRRPFGVHATESRRAGTIHFLPPCSAKFNSERDNPWAATFDYHGLPRETALATVDAVRAHTTALIRRLPEEMWARAGRHTESGRYTGEDGLCLYAEHLEGHARQIEGNVEQWRATQELEHTGTFAARTSELQGSRAG